MYDEERRASSVITKTIAFSLFALRFSFWKLSKLFNKGKIAQQVIINET